jgi:hypothetical protein
VSDVSNLDAILAIVERYVPSAGALREGAERLVVLNGALEAIKRAEVNVREARLELERLKEFGVSTENDYTAFDVLRSNLYAAQFGWYTLLKNTVSGVGGPRAASQLPSPVIVDGVRRPARVWRARSPIRFAAFPAIASRHVAAPPSGSSAGAPAGGEGLGAVQFTWGAAAIAILAVLALTLLYAYIVGSAIEEIARVLIVEKQTEQYRELLRARTAAYQVCLNGSEQQYADCVAAGGNGDVCRNTIVTQCLDAAGVLIPTPDDAGIHPPEPSSNNPYKWVLVGAGGVVVLIAGTLIYSWRKSGSGVRGLPSFLSKRTGPKMSLGEVPKRRKRTKSLKSLSAAKRVFDLDGPSEYDLEVTD